MDGLTRAEAVAHITTNREHHADCAETNERLLWDGDCVVREQA